MKKILQSIRGFLKRLTRGHITEEEIINLIEEGEQEGVINEDEHAMIDAVLDLDETRVREILVPRTDMLALEKNTGIDQVLKTVLDAGHSRIPVYEGDVDHIIGILYVKDLLKNWGQDAEKIRLESLVRKAYFIPESKTIADLLREFKVRRVHMAVAVDEYGGTSGIVTIEDILEEIVGEIQDEHDPDAAVAMTEIGEGEYLFDARSHIEDVEEELEVQFPRGDYDTLGGFISHLSGHVPVEGEQCTYGSLLFTVEEADVRRVSRIRVKKVSQGAAG